VAAFGGHRRDGGESRASFGDVGVPEEQMTGPGTGANLTAGCHGCHSLSRDGKYMVLNFDDDDSDDEYTDVKSALVDEVQRVCAPVFMLFDFQEFAREVCDDILRRYEKGESM